jgi:hypothetical protein
VRFRFISSKSAQRWCVAAILLAIAAVLYVEQARLVEQLLARYANEEQTLLWNAAADWARPGMREPPFYAQPYVATLEAIPVAVLRALGIGYGAGVPITLLALALVAWGLLVWGALRGGYWLPAIAAAALPVLLNIEHWVGIGTSGPGTGRLLGALSAALALAYPTARASVFAGVGSAGVALVVDPSTCFLVVPLLVWWLVRALRSRELREPVVLGLLPLASIRLFNQWLERNYLGPALRAGPGFELDGSVLYENLGAPDRLFGPHALELVPHAALLFWVLASLWIVALAVRAFRELAAVSSLIALVAGFAALPASLESTSSIWSSAARSGLALPMGAWFTFAVTWRAAAEWLEPRLGVKLRMAQLTAAGLVLLTAALSVHVRGRHWNRRIGALESAGVTDPRLPVRSVEGILQQCDEVVRLTVQANTPIVAFPFDRTATYACPAIHPALLTVNPNAERRLWVQRQLAEPAHSLLLWGVPPETCRKKRMRRVANFCRPLRGTSALFVRFKPQSPLDVVRALGYRS